MFKGICANWEAFREERCQDLKSCHAEQGRARSTRAQRRIGKLEVISWIARRALSGEGGSGILIWARSTKGALEPEGLGVHRLVPSCFVRWQVKSPDCLSLHLPSKMEIVMVTVSVQRRQMASGTAPFHGSHLRMTSLLAQNANKLWRGILAEGGSGLMVQAVTAGFEAPLLFTLLSV